MLDFIKLTIQSLGLSGLLFLMACQGEVHKESPKQIVLQSRPLAISEKNQCQELNIFQTLKIAKHFVDLALPPDSVEIRGNLLILQGWKFPKDDWCKKSSLCKKARARGYRLIMPEMGLSTYATRLYPETRQDWRKYPTRPWVTDTLIPYLQENYCVMEKEQKNFVVGLSTGARGAALVTLYSPDLFQATAALSGDYDQRLIPKERIMNGFYGSPTQFPERWAGEDNLITQIAGYQTPSYLGHGQRDYICPPNQTQLFYDSLKARYPYLDLELSMPDWAGHDYRYWDYEVDRFLAFFEKYL